MTDYAGAIVDLDGTVWRGDDLLAGAREGIEALRGAGIAITFASNGTDIDRDGFDDRLAELGLPTDIEVITAASATAAHLADEHPDTETYVIGQQPIAAELNAWVSRRPTSRRSAARTPTPRRPTRGRPTSSSPVGNPI
jgi:4-nitrophenyl phosphatase